MNPGNAAVPGPTTVDGQACGSGNMETRWRAKWLATLLMCGAVTLPATLPAQAAPVLPAAGNGLDTLETSGGTPTPGAKTPGIIDGGAVTEVPNQSKTIEMLLEMQGKNPGLAGGERPRQEMPTGSRTLAAPAASAPANPFGVGDPANPFGGSGLTPDKARATPQDSAVDWSAGPSTGLGAGAGTGAFSSSGAPQREFSDRPAQASRSSEDDDVRWLIPRRVVNFVRENRQLVVIGSVVVLLLLWGATAMASGRRK
jgi:hypothetical protein